MWKSNQGFTLVEAMITAAVLAILALGISSMMYHQQKAQKAAQAKATFNSLLSTVQSASENPKTLLNSAGAQTPQNISDALKQIDTNQ